MCVTITLYVPALSSVGANSNWSLACARSTQLPPVYLYHVLFNAYDEGLGLYTGYEGNVTVTEAFMSMFDAL